MTSCIFSFGNRVAVITGGSKNIGLAIANNFALAGLKVAIISSNQESLGKAVKKLQMVNLTATGWLCDITKINDIDSVLNNINKHYGSIDILVNCAGLLSSSSIEELLEKDWDNVLSVNLKSSFFMVQKILPYLKKGNHPRIINISSNAGRMGGFANGMSYSASKVA